MTRNPDRAHFGLNKRGNLYAEQLGAIYNTAPKAVLGAIAVSLAMRLSDDDFVNARQLVIAEWSALHNAGILPQPAPRDAGGDHGEPVSRDEYDRDATRDIEHNAIPEVLP